MEFIIYASLFPTRLPNILAGKIFLPNQRETGSCITNFKYAYAKNKEFAKALDFYFKSLIINEQPRVKGQLVATNGNIGAMMKVRKV